VAYIELITVLHYCSSCIRIWLVAHARYGVKAPAVSGDGHFERYYRCSKHSGICWCSSCCAVDGE